MINLIKILFTVCPKISFRLSFDLSCHKLISKVFYNQTQKKGCATVGRFELTADRNKARSGIEFRKSVLVVINYQVYFALRY